MRRRVVFFTDTAGIGGAEDVLAHIVANAERSRWSARVMLSDRAAVTPLAERLQDTGVPVDRLPVSPQIPWQKRFLVCVRYLVRVRPDVLYVNRPSMGHGLPGIMAGWLGRVPRIIVHEHFVPPSNGMANPAHPAAVGAGRRRGGPGWDAGRFRRTIPARIARWVIVPSNVIRTLCVAHYGYPPDRTRAVRFGIDVDGVAASVVDAAGLRLELGLSEDAPVVFCAARFTAEKGHGVLLQAMAVVAREYPSAVLVLAGDGPLRGAVETESRRRALEDRVRFLGQRGDVPRLLAASDVVVVPSLWESLPRVVLEAMALGRPVVASAVGGIPEAVLDGETGLLVPAGDPQRLAEVVVDLLRAPARRTALGEAGQRRARADFSLQRSLSEIYELMET
jgi:glycosyltransferase involved in cell wall biosynthesis